MSVKSVIEIDLDDAKWKRFAASYSSFQKALANSPFAAINKGITAAAKEQEKAQKRTTGEVKARIAALKDETREITKQLSVWSQIATVTRDFSDRLRGVQTLLTRMGVGTAIAGVLGVGSLFGLDRLAGAVGGGRRGAQGLGVSYGQARAFNLNFERLVDAPGFLSGVADALNRPGGAVPLQALGFNQHDLQGKGAANAAAELLPALKRLADRTQPEMLASVLQAYHLDELGIGLGDLRRLRATSPAELAGIVGGYRRDTRALGLQDDTARAWQNFYIQMERAGQTIETVFIKKLTPIIPGLEHLSASVVKAIETFLGPSDKINTGLTKLGAGIEWFAGYVGSDDFQTKMKNFVVGVGEFADATVSALRYLGVISTPSPTAGAGRGGILTGRAPRGLFQGDTFNDRFNAAGATTGGLNSDLASKLAQLRAAALRDIGEEGRITSGYRSRADQERLYRDRFHNPYPVARPGFSEHERGLAADVAGSRRFMDYVHAHAGEYGLNFPHANDPVHVQLSNPRVDIRIDNPAGANVFTSTNAVGQAP